MSQRQTNPWDKARQRTLRRPNPFRPSRRVRLDRDCNYFVLALERLGATVEFAACNRLVGFYVDFRAPYRLAERIARLGYLPIQLVGRQRVSRRGGVAPLLPCWSLRLPRGPGHRETLRAAAEAWERGMFKPASVRNRFS
jgi:hypothetical protein